MTIRSWWGSELLDNSDALATDAWWAWAHGQVTVGVLRREVNRLAATLSIYGIRPGNTVALRGTPSFTQLWCIFALWSLGAQVQLFDPRLDRVERAALL